MAKLSLVLELTVFSVYSVVLALMEETPVTLKTNLMSIHYLHTTSHILLAITKTIVAMSMLIRGTTTYIYIATIVCLFIPVVSGSRPALFVPWLLLALIRCVFCNFIMLFSGFSICVVFSPLKPACMEFVFIKSIETVIYTYYWMKMNQLYIQLCQQKGIPYIPFLKSFQNPESLRQQELILRRKRTRTLGNNVLPLQRTQEQVDTTDDLSMTSTIGSDLSFFCKYSHSLDSLFAQATVEWFVKEAFVHQLHEQDDELYERGLAERATNFLQASLEDIMEARRAHCNNHGLTALDSEIQLITNYILSLQEQQPRNCVHESTHHSKSALSEMVSPVLLDDTAELEETEVNQQCDEELIRLRPLQSQENLALSSQQTFATHPANEGEPKEVFSYQEGRCIQTIFSEDLSERNLSISHSLNPEEESKEQGIVCIKEVETVKNTESYERPLIQLTNSLSGCTNISSQPSTNEQQERAIEEFGRSESSQKEGGGFEQGQFEQKLSESRKSMFTVGYNKEEEMLNCDHEMIVENVPTKQLNENMRAKPKLSIASKNSVILEENKRNETIGGEQTKMNDFLRIARGYFERGKTSEKLVEGKENSSMNLNISEDKLFGNEFGKNTENDQNLRKVIGNIDYECERVQTGKKSQLLEKANARNEEIRQTSSNVTEISSGTRRTANIREHEDESTSKKENKIEVNQDFDTGGTKKNLEAFKCFETKFGSETEVLEGDGAAVQEEKSKAPKLVAEFFGSSCVVFKPAGVAPLKNVEQRQYHKDDSNTKNGMEGIDHFSIMFDREKKGEAKEYLKKKIEEKIERVDENEDVDEKNRGKQSKSLSQGEKKMTVGTKLDRNFEKDPNNDTFTESTTGERLKRKNSFQDYVNSEDAFSDTGASSGYFTKNRTNKTAGKSENLELIEKNYTNKGNEFTQENLRTMTSKVPQTFKKNSDLKTSDISDRRHPHNSNEEVKVYSNNCGIEFIKKIGGWNSFEEIKTIADIVDDVSEISENNTIGKEVEKLNNSRENLNLEKNQLATDNFYASQKIKKKSAIKKVGSLTESRVNDAIPKMDNFKKTHSPNNLCYSSESCKILKDRKDSNEIILRNLSYPKVAVGSEEETMIENREIFSSSEKGRKFGEVSETLMRKTTKKTKMDGFLGLVEYNGQFEIMNDSEKNVISLDNKELERLKKNREAEIPKEVKTLIEINQKSILAAQSEKHRTREDIKKSLADNLFEVSDKVRRDINGVKSKEKISGTQQDSSQSSLIKRNKTLKEMEKQMRDVGMNRRLKEVKKIKSNLALKSSDLGKFNDKEETKFFAEGNISKFPRKSDQENKISNLVQMTGEKNELIKRTFQVGESSKKLERQKINGGENHFKKSKITIECASSDFSQKFQIHKQKKDSKSSVDSRFARNSEFLDKSEEEWKDEKVMPVKRTETNSNFEEFQKRSNESEFKTYKKIEKPEAEAQKSDKLQLQLTQRDNFKPPKEINGNLCKGKIGVRNKLTEDVSVSCKKSVLGKNSGYFDEYQDIAPENGGIFISEVLSEIVQEVEETEIIIETEITEIMKEDETITEEITKTVEIIRTRDVFDNVGEGMKGFEDSESTVNIEIFERVVEPEEVSENQQEKYSSEVSFSGIRPCAKIKVSRESLSEPSCAAEIFLVDKKNSSVELKDRKNLSSCSSDYVGNEATIKTFDSSRTVTPYKQGNGSFDVFVLNNKILEDHSFESFVMNEKIPRSEQKVGGIELYYDTNGCRCVVPNEANQRDEKIGFSISNESVTNQALDPRKRGEGVQETEAINRKTLVKSRPVKEVKQSRPQLLASMAPLVSERRLLDGYIIKEEVETQSQREFTARLKNPRLDQRELVQFSPPKNIVRQLEPQWSGIEDSLLSRKGQSNKYLIEEEIEAQFQREQTASLRSPKIDPGESDESVEFNIMQTLIRPRESGVTTFVALGKSQSNEYIIEEETEAKSQRERISRLKHPEINRSESIGLRLMKRPKEMNPQKSNTTAFSASEKRHFSGYVVEEEIKTQTLKDKTARFKYPKTNLTLEVDEQNCDTQQEENSKFIAGKTKPLKTSFSDESFGRAVEMTSAPKTTKNSEKNLGNMREVIISRLKNAKVDKTSKYIKGQTNLSQSSLKVGKSEIEIRPSKEKSWVQFLCEGKSSDVMTEPCAVLHYNNIFNDQISVQSIKDTESRTKGHENNETRRKCNKIKTLDLCFEKKSSESKIRASTKKSQRGAINKNTQINKRCQKKNVDQILKKSDCKEDRNSGENVDINEEGVAGEESKLKIPFSLSSNTIISTSSPKFIWTQPSDQQEIEPFSCSLSFIQNRKSSTSLDSSECNIRHAENTSASNQNDPMQCPDLFILCDHTEHLIHKDRIVHAIQPPILNGKDANQGRQKNGCHKEMKTYSNNQLEEF